MFTVCQIHITSITSYVYNMKHQKVWKPFLSPNWKHCRFSFCDCLFTKVWIGRVFLIILIMWLITRTECLYHCVYCRRLLVTSLQSYFPFNDTDHPGGQWVWQIKVWQVKIIRIFFKKGDMIAANAIEPPLSITSGTSGPGTRQLTWLGSTLRVQRVLCTSGCEPRTSGDRGSWITHSAKGPGPLASRPAEVLSVEPTVSDSVTQHSAAGQTEESSEASVSWSESESCGSNKWALHCSSCPPALPRRCCCRRRWMTEWRNDWQPGRCQSKCDLPRPHGLDKWFEKQL